jgi:hypothetical protein
VFQAVTNPHQACQQEQAVGCKEESGNVSVSPIAYFIIGLVSRLRSYEINSPVDPIGNVNKVVKSDESNDNIAYFTCDFSDFNVLLHSFFLIFSPEHLSHFKVSEGEQEVRLVVHAVGNVIKNL